jgi:hypothetical protein
MYVHTYTVGSFVLIRKVLTSTQLMQEQNAEIDMRVT